MKSWLAQIYAENQDSDEHPVGTRLGKDRPMTTQELVTSAQHSRLEIESNDKLRRSFLRNILWATDFSAASQVSLSYAAALARRHSSRLYAAHILGSHTKYFGPGMPLLRLGLAEQLAVRRMSNLLDSQALSEVAYQRVVGLGKASRALANMAQDFDIDLIILGTRGSQGLSNAILGSVAHQTVRLVPCPALTISTRVSLQAPFYMELQRILCAVDFSLASISAARSALAWAREYRANLILFHAVEGPVVEALDERGRLKNYYLRRLERVIPPRASREVALETRVEFGAAGDWIVKAGWQSAADLIVVGTRNVNTPGGRPRGRTTQEVLNNACSPVLTVNEDYLAV